MGFHRIVHGLENLYNSGDFMEKVNISILLLELTFKKLNFFISLNCTSNFGIIGAVEIITEVTTYTLLKYFLEIYREGFFLYSLQV